MTAAQGAPALPTLAVVGVGLLGASVALAARRRGVAGRVLGIDRDAEAVDLCRRRGGLDHGSTDLLAAATADLVVFCTPVDCIADLVLRLAPHCHPGTLLTDVGSTKSAISAVAERLPPGVVFVGSHPLAGSEKQGPAHAHPDLFQGRLVVVTPGPGADERAVSCICAFWEALGAICRRMSAVEHDQALALTSHLPHVVASALAAALPPELTGLTATGFRDTTRLAASGPDLWTAILLSNRTEVLAALARYGEQLERFRAALEANDPEGLRRLLAAGKAMRDGLSV
jgi:cyclohexadieny/prephenate dehydrogenase